MLKRLTCFFLALLLAFSFSPASLWAFEPSPEDRELLNKIEKDTFQYFTRFSDKLTGLTKDSSRAGSPTSVAATGFALAAYAIGASVNSAGVTNISAGGTNIAAGGTAILGSVVNTGGVTNVSAGGTNVAGGGAAIMNSVVSGVEFDQLGRPKK